MGQLKGDGRATNVTWAGTGAINFGELYRQDGWNGIAMEDVAVNATERDTAMEISDRIWYVSIPAAVVANKGDLLYWATGQSEPIPGATQLSATPNGEPCCIVEDAVDANDICGIRVLNVGKPAT